MRAALLVLCLGACAPRVAPKPPSFDEDFAPRRVADVPPDDPLRTAPRPTAPSAPGARTGTIERAALLAVLDAGPPTFLSRLEVTAKMAGDRFIGWELVQLLEGSLLDGIDVIPGDVLLSINGLPLSRPDQLQRVWDTLRTAPNLTAELWRGDAQLTLAFSIIDRP